jgi:hypothetical protein
MMTESEGRKAYQLAARVWHALQQLSSDWLISVQRLLPGENNAPQELFLFHAAHKKLPNCNAQAMITLEVLVGSRRNSLEAFQKLEQTIVEQFRVVQDATISLVQQQLQANSPQPFIISPQKFQRN